MADRTTAPAVLVEGPDGALHEVGLAHGRTLLGAIDAHVGYLHHTRPWLVAEREEALEDMADAWLDGGNPNWLPAVDDAWLDGYLGPSPAPTAAAIGDFRAWAARHGLIAEPARGGA